MDSIDVGTEQLRVLVIEDDPAQQLRFCKLLETVGYEYATASTHEEALAQFRPGLYACAVVDLGLPDGSGLSLLPLFAREDPALVTVILTGDASSETIIETMRVGAFDYLTKPVDSATLRAAVARAAAHHTVLRERQELTLLLLEERELLRARVEAATADLRQYAATIETHNIRLRTLLRLVQLSESHVSTETLLRQVFEELAQLLPVHCIALCDVSHRQFVGVVQGKNPEDAPQFVSAEDDTGLQGFDQLLAEAEPESLMQNWVERHTGLDTSGLMPFVYSQAYWGRTLCTVGIYLTPDTPADDPEREFLGMCAHFLAFEWVQARLLLQIAHNASLGNIGIELARNFVQPLSAIRIAADLVMESGLSNEAKEGMRIVLENTERLNRQTQQFRKLSQIRAGCLETVSLDQYVEQAIEMLSVAIQNRNVTVVRELTPHCECVLLNSTALARTFLDLILGALRSVEVGGTVTVRAHPDPATDHAVFELVHQRATGAELEVEDLAFFPTIGGPGRRHPGLQLAERTVRSCGGNLTLRTEPGAPTVLRIFLPRTASNLRVDGAGTW